jgi:hypothetical protein
MSMRRRSAVLIPGVSSVVALAVLSLVGSSVASAEQPQTAPTAQASAGAPLQAAPPLGRPKASGLSPDLSPTGGSSPWTPLKNPPPFGTPGTMLLESDGTVLVHDEPDNDATGGTEKWFKLTPDSHGSYVDGTWSAIAPMPTGYRPLYFASAILPDGRMIVEGGEYNGNPAVWSKRGAVYNPVTNTWASVAPPPGWTNIGDASSEVLTDGTFMLQQVCRTCTTNKDLTVGDALLDPKTMTWKVIPGTGKNDPNSEEGWTLLPSGQVLTVDVRAVPQTQLYNPGSRTWSFAGNTAPGGNPVNPLPVAEIGPQVGMPGGNVFVVGAGVSTQYPPTCTTRAQTQTALYHYKAGTAGTWTAGPRIPTIDGQEFSSTDGPGSILPDGDVLFDVSACVYNAPLHFFRYHPDTNTLTRVPDVANAPNDSSFLTRMLALPNGQVLFDDESNQMAVFTAGGTPQAAWRPSITSLSSSTLARGSTYTLSGRQLAGLDQGAAYGDDAQASTNYPLVRIVNSATGAVRYARTHDWTSVSIAPGTRSSTAFTVAPNTPTGRSTLVVVANGIASAPVQITIR